MELMSSGLQITLIIGSIVTLICVLYNVVRTKMDIKYAIIWVLLGLFILIIAVFPQLIKVASDALGILTASNMVFLLTIFLLYCLSFYTFLKMSKMQKDIKTLTYEVSVLKKNKDE